MTGARRAGAALAGALRGSLAVAAANLRRQAGDRRLLVVATVVPVALILLTGLLTGGSKVPLGVVDAGPGPAATRLVALLSHGGGLTLHAEPSRAALDDDILRGRVVAGVVIPPGFGSNGRLAVTFVGEGDQPQAVQAHTAVTGRLALLAAEQQAAASGPAPRAAAATDRALAGAAATARPPLSPFSYAGPADLVLFAGITLLVMSAGLVESRRLGVLRRVAASPIRPGGIVAGQLLGLGLAGLGQALGLLLVGRVLFGVRWGSPVAVALLVLGLTAALAGLATLLGTLARTQEQAVAVGVVLALAAGMLGGCLWPLSVVGPAMQAVGHLTPQAWAMDGFVALVYGHAGLVAVLPDIAALAGFAAVLCTLAAWRLGRQTRRVAGGRGRRRHSAP